MSERNNLSELFRKAMDTNLKFYSGLAELSVDYLKNVGELISELPSQVKTDSSTSEQTSSAAIVLEAGVGEQVRAPLLVENHLSREVSVEVSISAFTDDDDNETTIEIYPEPANLTLQPGEKTLIQIISSIDEQLTSGVSYRGSITVPELSENSIPIIVRRLDR